MSILCKMRLNDVVSNVWGSRKAFFYTEYDQSIPEDQSFTKATPTGSAEFVIDNPAATEQLVIGKSYYFTITPAD